MTEQQFTAKAIERVKQVIDCIAGKEYSKLHTITNIDRSWYKDGETQAEGMNRFAQWLEEQLKMWSEYYGKEFTVDHFREEKFEVMQFKGDRAFVTYTAQSNGEELDFWFEFEFTIDDNDRVISEFNINI